MNAAFTRCPSAAILGTPSQRTVGTARRPLGCRIDKGKRLTSILHNSLTTELLLRTIGAKLHEPIWNEYHLGATYVALERLEISGHDRARWSGVITSLVHKTQMMSAANVVDARGLANILWATAKLKDKLPETVDALPALMDAFPHVITGQRLNAQELSNALWAVATLQLSTGKVEPIAAAVLVRMHGAPESFSEQHLSNVLWSAATLQFDTDSVQPIAAAIAHRTKSSPHGFNEQALANMLWAAATLQMHEVDVLPVITAVADRTSKTPHKFKQQELSNILWAAATLASRQGR